MPHEIEKEALSAFLDQALAPGEHARIQVHLASCAQCRAYLARITAASALVKKHAQRPLPPTVEAVAVAETRARRRRSVLETAGVVAAVVGIALAGGIALKWMMPEFYSQLQGMISGAANSLGH